jgi:hypothetical protein
LQSLVEIDFSFDYLSEFFLGNTFSIAFFNFAGVSVTKELSSTTRMVLDNCRTVLVYIISATAFQAPFHELDILGLIVLIIGKFNFSFIFQLRENHLGVGIYNGVWAHLYRRYVKREKPVNEKIALISREE